MCLWTSDFLTICPWNSNSELTAPQTAIRSCCTSDELVCTVCDMKIILFVFVENFSHNMWMCQQNLTYSNLQKWFRIEARIESLLRLDWVLPRSDSRVAGETRRKPRHRARRLPGRVRSVWLICSLLSVSALLSNISNFSVFSWFSWFRI